MSKNKKSTSQDVIKNMLKNKQWLIIKGDNKYDINENVFIELFINQLELKFIGGKFYNINGLLEEDELKQIIIMIIKEDCRTNLKTKVKSIIDAMKIWCSDINFKVPSNEINTLSNTLVINDYGEIKIEDKKVAINVLNVDYMPNIGKPTMFLKYLDELLYQNDIIILQEYLGYCLIASIVAHKSLFIIGKSGIGKSVFGKVLKSIFGYSLLEKQLHKLFDDNNRFAFTNLPLKLIVLDDDVNLSKQLKDSQSFKTIITGINLTIEEKFAHEYNTPIYSRVIGFGNGMLNINKKEQENVLRRFLILETKDIPSNRIIDPFIDEKISEEKNAIFKWALDGLTRLIKNNYQFSFHEEMKERVKNILDSTNIDDNNYIYSFLSDQKYIEIDGFSKSWTEEIYETYKQWAIDNKLKVESTYSFSRALANSYNDFGLEKKEFNKKGTNKQGYIGLKTKI